jgi:hypothetical protein
MKTAVSASLLTGHSGTTLGAAHLVTGNTSLMGYFFATTGTGTFATRPQTRTTHAATSPAAGATSFGPLFTPPLHFDPPSLIHFGVLAEC